MKKIASLVLFCTMAFSAFAEAPTELVMYLIGNPTQAYWDALAVFNKKAQADLNLTLKVNFIGWGDFSQKYPLVLASGEPIDLIYTSTWLQFPQQALKGAFMPLEDIGPKFAPESFKLEPKEGLRQATLNGHLYALPPNFTQYAFHGPIYRGDLGAKVGVPEIKSFDDWGKFMVAVHKSDATIDPAGMYATIPMIDASYWYQNDLYPLSGDPVIASPFWIDVNDKTGKVVNIVDRADTPDLLKKLYAWSKAGAWPKSVLSNKDDKMFQTGKAASVPWNIDNWVGQYMQNPQWDVKFFSMLKHTYALPYMQDGMAIPASAKHPDLALKLLDKLRNDKSYYMLLSYGIEGKQYKMNEKGELIALDNTNWPPEQFCNWGYRDNRFRPDMAGSPASLKDVRAAAAKAAVDNPYVSFTQVIEPVKNEYAAVVNVMTQYWVPLKLGYVEPVAGLKTLKEKLKAAGVAKVEAEFQKQLNAFLAARK
jgi:putative aldouronate transport system substrate-binding protein